MAAAVGAAYDAGARRPHVVAPLLGAERRSLSASGCRLAAWRSTCWRARTPTNCSAFFSQQGERLRGPGAERLRDAERLFQRCLEGSIEHLLSPADRTILRAEREFAPRGAGARLAAPSAILQVLPTFLETWGGAELEERRVQLTVAERLLELVSTFPPVEDEVAPLHMTVRVALQRSRRRYDLARLMARARVVAP